ncbi:hypothetical protein [Caldalkalibacillus mannanilyticus]|uniref:hypothetical protein n=1 Tax=Caldalkalibacillus mannanilyticus TaxID=1418 RepID=UPI00046A6651|nr:hypothetical protein [Caldalkalibacillus mannanilyticus]
MLDQFKPIFKLYWLDVRFSYMIFWIILLSTSLFFVGLSYYISNGDIFIGGGIAIYIYLMIHALINVSETLPYALGMGSTRKKYMQGTIVCSVILAAVTTILEFVYFKVFSIAILGLDYPENIRISFFNLEGFSPTFLLGLEFGLCLFILAFFQLISILYYRYGYTPFYFLFAIFLLLIMTPLGNVGKYFFGILDNVENAMYPLLILVMIGTVLSLLFSWLVLRNSPSKPARG